MQAGGRGSALLMERVEPPEPGVSEERSAGSVGVDAGRREGSFSRQDRAGGL